MRSTLIHNSLKIITIMIVIISVLHHPIQVRAASQTHDKFDEYQVKSVFLYNLAFFIFWPEESCNKTDRKFVITILGNDKFGRNLEEITKNEKVGDCPIIVRRINSIKNLQSSHILFITSGFANTMSTIIEKAEKRGILTVSDYSNFLSAGGAVNLQIHNNKLHLGLNPSAAKKNNLVFSSKLLQLAKHIESTPHD